MIARLDALDTVLVEHGFHPLSPWWRRELGRFLTSGRRRWVIRAGRRSGKSSTLCRLAVAQALWGSWSVPTGDVGVVAFVSVSRDEASARLRTIVAILRALGLQFDERADEIELRDRPVLFKVFTCSVRTSVGFTSIAVLGDEAARWESRETGANPAREVVGSLAPTLATQPNGFLVLSSSALTRGDYHAERVEEGDTEHQLVSTGTSWECNPTLTEQQTHALEPDLRIWSREYANIPNDGSIGAFFEGLIDQCVDKDRDGESVRGDSGHRYVAAIDPGFRRDGFGFAICHREATNDQVRTVVDQAQVWRPHNGRAVSVETVVRATAALARAHGCSVIFTDQHSIDALTPLYLASGVRLVDARWTQSNKADRFEAIRAEMESGRLRLPNAPDLLRELRGIGSRLLPSGSVQIQARGSGHDDLVCATVMAASLALQFEPDRGSGQLGSHGFGFPGYARSHGAADVERGPRITHPHPFTGQERRRWFLSDESGETR